MAPMRCAARSMSTAARATRRMRAIRERRRRERARALKVCREPVELVDACKRLCVFALHIGLIGGIGPAATAFYYQRIVRLFAEAKTPLNLTIVHTDIGRLATNVKANNVLAQAEEYRRVTEQLAAAGADKVAITSFGGSFCADEFEKISPLPMMDGPTAMAEHLREAGLQRVGILGITPVMSSKLYGKLDGVCECLTPGDDGADAMQQVHADYKALAMGGVATDELRSRLFLRAP